MRDKKGQTKSLLTEINSKPMIVAHRGFSGKAPENTMTAFSMAIETGVSMIELDVQISKDGEVMVIHDPTVDRTTNGTGRVSDLTLKELKALDAGSWFDPVFKNERIPTLAEAIDLIASKSLVNIELKSARIVRKTDTRLADASIGVVRGKKLFDRVLFSSFNHKLVRYIKETEPSAHTGVIFHPLLHFGKLPSTLASSAKAEVFICGKRDATRRRINDAVKNDIIMGVYGVESDHDIEKMLSMGIRVLVSDHPDILIEGVRRHNNQKAS